MSERRTLCYACRNRLAQPLFFFCGPCNRAYDKAEATHGRDDVNGCWWIAWAHDRERAALKRKDRQARSRP